MPFFSSLLIAAASASPDMLLGDWQCDSYKITRPDFVVSISSRVNYSSGGAYSSHGTGTYTFDDAGEVKIDMEFSGAWELDGNVLRSRADRVEIKRVEPPIISNDAARAVVEGGATFGKWRESRVLSIGQTLVTEPLEPVEGQSPLQGSCSKT